MNKKNEKEQKSGGHIQIPLMENREGNNKEEGKRRRQKERYTSQDIIRHKMQIARR